MVGSSISHYHVLHELGSGGMGQVFEAEDTVLQRRVALKLLPETLAGNAEALERFKREARALAALNHPNIVTVYSVEASEGRHFLTMELVQGKPLSDLIPPGGLSLPEFSKIAVPLAEALAAAHEKGITHRDLKPTNVMVSDRGVVKVIDFGLAKLMDPPAPAQTIDGTTRLLTVEGKLLGTPAYMSPEQVEGRNLDSRTDIFSLGVVMCEMVTGQRPFKGNTPISLMSAVLKDAPPPIHDVKPELPEALGRVIYRCLEKDPGQRYQTADLLRKDLLRISDETAVLSRGNGRTQTPPARSAAMKWLPWVAAGAGAAVLAWIALPERARNPAGTVAHSKSQSGDAKPAPPLILRLEPSRQVTYDPGLEDWPSWAPDGDRVAYSAEIDGFKNLVVRSLKTGEVAPLARTNRDEIMAAWNPANPDEVVFVRHKLPGGKLELSDVYGGFFASAGDLWKHNVRTGQEVLLCRDGYNPSFSKNGMLAFHHDEDPGNTRIYTSDSDGRRMEVQTRDDSTAIMHLEPSFAPDGSKIVYRREEKNSSSLWVIDLKTREQFAITKSGLYVQPAWSPTGKHVYFSSYLGRSGMNLWRIPVDPNGKSAGDPEPVTSGQGADLHPALSPDGKQLLFCISRANSDIWKLPVDPLTGMAKGPPVPVVATSREDSRGAWSRDEKWIAFNSDRDNGNMNLWVREMQTGRERQITTGPGGDYQPDWSSNGNSLAFFSLRSGNADIWSVDIENGEPRGEPRQLTSDRAQDMNPFFSPDGTRIAFMSDRDGRTEIYVMNRDGSGQRRLSSTGTGGHFLRWHGDSVVFNSRINDEWCAASVNMEGETKKWITLKPPPDKPKWGVGGHMSLSPDGAIMMELAAHLDIWTVPVSGAIPQHVFHFETGERIDYPVWSPSGNWVLFDRMLSQGSDLYLINGLD